MRLIVKIRTVLALDQISVDVKIATFLLKMMGHADLVASGGDLYKV